MNWEEAKETGRIWRERRAFYIYKKQKEDDIKLRESVALKEEFRVAKYRNYFEINYYAIRKHCEELREQV